MLYITLCLCNIVFRLNNLFICLVVVCQVLGLTGEALRQRILDLHGYLEGRQSLVNSVSDRDGFSFSIASPSPAPEQPSNSGLHAGLLDSMSPGYAGAGRRNNSNFNSSSGKLFSHVSRASRVSNSNNGIQPTSLNSSPATSTTVAGAVFQEPKVLFAFRRCIMLNAARGFVDIRQPFSNVCHLIICINDLVVTEDRSDRGRHQSGGAVGAAGPQEALHRGI